MLDLSTTYMGLNLKHPLVPSASPLSATLDGIRRMEDADAAAVVLYSLFAEQLAQPGDQLDHSPLYAAASQAESLTYFPDLQQAYGAPEEYLNLIQRAKAATTIPLIESLNGAWPGADWTQHARLIEAAGADALELNLYFLATNPSVNSTQIEQMVLDVVREVRAAVSIPIAVKLSPYFSALANLASRLATLGINALVLFNRFYQPDLELATLEVVPHLELSDSSDLRLPLRWVAILYGRVPLDLAITSGVHTAEDALKGVLAGAQVTMMASELLQHGLGRIAAIRAGIETWLAAQGYASIAQLQGSLSQRNVADPAAFERAHYMKGLHAWRPAASGPNPSLPAT